MISPSSDGGPRNSRSTSADPGSPREVKDDAPGVPGFRSWRSVYWFVFGSFVLMVVALALFSRVYA